MARYHNRKVAEVIMPSERYKGDDYCPPGPVTVRQMTPEEREKYGLPQNKKVPYWLRAKYQQRKQVKQVKGESDMRQLPFEWPEGAHWKEVLTVERYRQLKELGWSDSKIIKACGSNNAEFYAWKDENGLMGVSVRKNGKAKAEVEAEVKTEAKAEPEAAVEKECNCGDECQCKDKDAESKKYLTFEEAVQRRDRAMKNIECVDLIKSNHSTFLTPEVFEALTQVKKKAEAEVEKLSKAKVVI